MNENNENVTTEKKAKNPLLQKWKKYPNVDFVFLVLVLSLLLIGLAMLYSASFAKAFSERGNSYYYISKQLQWAVLGLLAMGAASVFPYKFYKPVIMVLYPVCVALLALVYVLPSNDYQKRWIYIGGFQFQPSEIAKLAIILALAYYFSVQKKKERRPGEKLYAFEAKNFVSTMLIPGILFGVPCLLVLFETHLSGAILILGVGGIMLIASGCPKRYILPIVILAAVALLYVAFGTNYMTSRINVFLNPEADPSGDAYQIRQSLYAIGSGGLFGTGYGASGQKYLYLPEPQNDFIFAIVAEELGFVGVAAIVALFVLLIWRGIKIAMCAPNKFTAFIAFGITTQIALQVILNLAVVSNFIPVTGISLPFFSYGGTALAILLGEIGIMLQISRYATLKKK